MPRIARLKIKGESAVYHVMSRTALDGFVLGDIEKEFLLDLIKRLSKIYFAEVLGFCLMGNHFHLLVRMHSGDDYTDDDIKARFMDYYGRDREIEFSEGQIPFYRKKWEDLSEYIKEIKQGFSRFYNKRHERKGFFWSERFKSVIVDNGETLMNCLAYIDLNPIRAGLVSRPEDYRWSSIGYHLQADNRDNFLSMDFGLGEFNVKEEYKERLRYYRRFMYEKGSIEVRRKGLGDKSQKNDDIIEDYEIKAIDRFRYRTRYFTDSGVIGSKIFVDRVYRQFKDNFISRHEKKPKLIDGLEGVYSLKRLSEAI